MSGIIVHEWLAPAGGSENVFGAIAEAFPDAERWCLWKESGRFDPVHETWLARTPLKGRKALALPVMPAVWRTLPKRDADWVLTSTHLFAHHARFGGRAADAPKLVYAHTPARYIWVPELDARGDNLPARLVSRALKSQLRSPRTASSSPIGLLLRGSARRKSSTRTSMCHGFLPSHSSAPSMS
jgi:hypothetical protein